MEDARVENWLTARQEQSYFTKMAEKVLKTDVPSVPDILLYQSKTIEYGKLKVLRRARYQLTQTNVCHLLFKGVESSLPPSFVKWIQKHNISLEQFDCFDSHFYLNLDFEKEQKIKKIDHSRTILLVNPVNFEFKVGWISDTIVLFEYPFSPILDQKTQSKKNLAKETTLDQDIENTRQQIHFLSAVYENVCLIHRIYTYESACVFIPLAFELAEQTLTQKHPVFSILSYLNQDLKQFHQHMKYSYEVWSLFTLKNKKQSQKKKQNTVVSNRQESCFSFRKAKLLIFEFEQDQVTRGEEEEQEQERKQKEENKTLFVDPIHSFILSASSKMLNSTKVIFSRGYSNASLKNNPYYETYLSIQRIVRSEVEKEIQTWDLTTFQNAEFKLWGHKFCSFLRLDVSYLDNFEGIRALVDLICLKVFFWTGPWYSCFDPVHSQKQDHTWEHLLKVWNRTNFQIFQSLFFGRSSSSSSSSSSPSFPSLQTLMDHKETPELFRSIYRQVLNVFEKNEKLCINRLFV